MEFQFAHFPPANVLTPTPVATPTLVPRFSLTDRQAYLVPTLTPFFVITSILIVSKVFSKKIRGIGISYESLKIILLVAILTVLLIIAWQTRYEYFDSQDVLRLDKLTGTVERHYLIREIQQSKGVK